MLRMEIALFLVLAFVACMYFSADKERTALHRTFAVLLAAALTNLLLDGVTVYTVNHLDAVPLLLNDAVHRLFLGSMVLVIYLFYQYIAILVEEETGRPRRLDGPAKVFLAAAELGNFLLPISYSRKKNAQERATACTPRNHWKSAAASRGRCVRRFSVEGKINEEGEEKGRVCLRLLEGGMGAKAVKEDFDQPLRDAL